jgi:hypothetical protein
MVISTTKNLPEYHAVFADSLVSIVNMLGTNNEPAARKILTFNLRQAYVLYRMDTPSQRMEIDGRLAVIRKEFDATRKSKDLYPPGYDAVLKEELDAMALEKLSVEELEVKLFTYMTLAGIKPVQNNQQRAGGYERFNAGGTP